MDIKPSEIFGTINFWCVLVFSTKRKKTGRHNIQVLTTASVIVQFPSVKIEKRRVYFFVLLPDKHVEYTEL